MASGTRQQEQQAMRVLAMRGTGFQVFGLLPPPRFRPCTAGVHRWMDRLPPLRTSGSL